jgi:hypothetical protein
MALKPTVVVSLDEQAAMATTHNAIIIFPSIFISVNLVFSYIRRKNPHLITWGRAFFLRGRRFLHTFAA